MLQEILLFFFFNLFNKSRVLAKLLAHAPQWTLGTESLSQTLIEMNPASLLPSAVPSLVPIFPPDSDESPDKWRLPFHSLPVIQAIY